MERFYFLDLSDNSSCFTNSGFALEVLGFSVFFGLALVHRSHFRLLFSFCLFWSFQFTFQHSYQLRFCFRLLGLHLSFGSLFSLQNWNHFSVCHPLHLGSCLFCHPLPHHFLTIFSWNHLPLCIRCHTFWILPCLGIRNHYRIKLYLTLRCRCLFWSLPCLYTHYHTFLECCWYA